MATYNYKCTSCNSKMELRHGMNEDRPPCPECKEYSLEVFHTPESVPTFKTVGFGWGGKGHPVK
jgi:putative FmdB family regulatory protein